ncbi:putative ATP-dependent DNA helicase domain protein [Mycobacterium xenopi 4042]|uniref:Putative ATP-dependent DNA helicase domain protein n=1 Tax=Mycobacterium xenopi 4042 TaxID=1299334 RepID=X7YKL5_MYCXE|nr:putative ATP-dependent DNA helicase domain protein [Mycobacterium xenopi 4042]
MAKLAEEERAAAGQGVQDCAVGVVELHRNAGVNVNGAVSAEWKAIQPSLAEIEPAPDHITSPEASSSSSIAGE